MRIVTFVALASFLCGVYFFIRTNEEMDLSDSLEKLLRPELSGDMKEALLISKKYDKELKDLDILALKQSDNDPMGNPIVLWWTPFTGEIGSNRKCGTGSCFFTQVGEALY